MFEEKDLTLINALRQDNPDAYELIIRTEQDFLAILSRSSHDLCNTISLIECYGQLLGDRYPMLQQDDKWQKLRKNSQIQIRQLNDLATFRYSFRTEGMELFSIEDLISQLNHDYPDRLDICIHTVSNLIYGIKNNIICSVAALIENAMTAISASKAAQISDRQVHLQICTDNDLLHFIVTDYGCGFETDSNINPCAPFASCWKNHTGLGLSTARNTALRHGGNLIIKSLSNPTIVDFYIGIKN